PFHNPSAPLTLVSYTHLDVYKRVILTRLPFHNPSAPLTTHLDVYKRQTKPYTKSHG
ncbi:hypothetical protein A5869_001051, partial [Enterococcus cecorum]